MLNHLKIITITHKSVPLRDISNFMMKPTETLPLRAQLNSLKQDVGLEELCYVATCNRVMYFFISKTVLDISFATFFLQKVNPELNKSNVAAAVQLYEGDQAVAHLFEVAASIDSLVVGERQILGQLREAYDQCQAWGLSGDTIRLAFQRAVLCAKEIYAHTRIGDKPVSVVSLAIRKLLATQLPKDARLLLIGAGQTNALVAKFLLKHQFTNVTVFNRSLKKAQELAKIINCKALSINDLQTYTEGFDCIFVCTGATDPIIQPALYAQLLQGEQDAKLVIDLAIPHNVAPDVITNFNVHYIEIDGLRHLAEENMAFREKEVEKARQMMAQHIEAFPTLLRQRQMERAMSRIPEEIKAVKSKALQEVFRKDLDQLDATTRSLLDRMMTYMEKKCIAIPMKMTRELS